MLNFTITKKELQNQLKKLRPFTDPKSAMPILSNILIETAEPYGFSMKATNLDMALTVSPSKDFTVWDTGAACVNHRQLSALVKTLPKGNITFKVEENETDALYIGVEGGGKSKMPSMDSKEFPLIPKAETFIHAFDADIFKGALEKTSYATSPDETRQSMNAVNIERNNGATSYCGTDGHRLALVETKSHVSANNKHGTGEFTLLMPKTVIKPLLVKGMIAPGGEINLFADGGGITMRHYILRQANYEVCFRRIDGKFPNYRQVIPTENNIQVDVNREALKETLARVAVFADEKSKMVRFSFSNGKIEMVSDATGEGEGKEEIEAIADIPITTGKYADGTEYKGRLIVIGLSARYVLDILGSIESETVTFNLKDSDHSAMITDKADSGLTTIVMPMRL